jgi:hypothetical protein
VAVDAAGNLLIPDFNNDRVRIVAATSGTFYGQPMTAGDIYTVAGDGTFGFSGDGGPATSAELNLPFGVAVDAAGNLLIADGGNTRVRVVAAASGTFYGQPMTAGDIYTVPPPEDFRSNGIAVDAAGNLLLADAGDNGAGNVVWVVAASTGTFYGQPMTAGHIYQPVGDAIEGFSGDGGPATSAELGRPTGVAVDAAGNMLIADTANGRIRMVTR